MVDIDKYLRDKQLKIILNILIIISFIIPIAYFNMVYYVAGIEENYFIEMYWILNHWTSGEMGWFPLYSLICGILLLIIRKLLFNWESH